MKEFPFGTFGPEHLKKVKEGIHSFNKQNYWECHELLEDIWIEERNDPARNVYWAIIQVANSLYHIDNKNLTGALSQLKKAKEKFQRCEDQNILTDLVYRFLDWKQFKKLAFSIPEDASELNSFDSLYQFRFTNYPY